MREETGAGPTIGSILSSAAERAPSHPAVVQGERSLTFRELLFQTQRLAHYLAELGIGKGDPVGLLMPNCSAFIVAHYALARLGAVIVPVNPQFRGLLLQETLELTDAVCLIATTALRSTIHTMPSRPKALQRIVSLDENLEPGGAIALGTATTTGFTDGDPARLWSELPASPPAVEVGPDDQAILFTTSGTTGKPKGILVTHRQAILGIDAWVRRWDYDSRTISLMVAPFSHVVYNPLVIGAHRALGTALVLNNLQVRAAAREIERSRATAVMGTPSFWIQTLNDRSVQDRDLSSIGTIIFGAAPTPVPIIRKLRQGFPAARLYNCYGLTETCSAVSCLGSDQLEGREASVGVPHPGVQVSIRDSQHRELPAGETGEVYCRGPHVITAYYRAPEANETRFYDGWLRTGDVGYVDRDSFLYLLGRSDDMINVAGQKIYPRDIENVLYNHPGVFDAAVVAVEDASRGHAVRAFVVPAEPGALDLASLERFCIRNLPPAFVPKYYDVVEELPRNASGKILRRDLANSELYGSQGR